MKYRKKPVVVEAVTWNGKYSGPGEWPDWFNNAMASGHIYESSRPDKAILVRTPEGTMLGNVGDKIIQGVRGELYPCKPDIFAATYEEA